uniref:Solute carrier organic anion transporter family member n=1 Tax=Mesocestoides corti TaxID=53468 RepID=A0A5K3EXT0_MESCO
MHSPHWNPQFTAHPPSLHCDTRTASNTSLIDWDKNVINYVYSCMYPEPYRPTPFVLPSPTTCTAFRKAHRRIVSATSSHAFQRTSTKHPRLIVSHARGHMRNASDPGMHIFYPQPPNAPIFLPTTTTVDEERNISNVEVPVRGVEHGSCSEVDEDGVRSPGKLISKGPSGSSCPVPGLRFWANSVVLLIALCAMAFFQSMVSSGYLSSIITTLERRFDLTSRQVGYIYCCYEVTSVLSTIGFSFINVRKRNRPRIIGVLGLVLGLGFCFFALPHWLSGPYNPSEFNNVAANKIEPLCSVIDVNTTVPSPPSFVDRSHCNLTGVTVLRIGEESVLSTDYTIALPFFCCSLAVAGFGSSSLFVLAPTFLWDNLSPRQYPIYSGLLYSCAGLGPAFGFIAGAAFLQIYIDSPSINPPPSLDVYDQSWLGAWWLGMVIFGALSCIPALPVLGFSQNLLSKVDSESLTVPTASTAETTVVLTPKSGAKPRMATGDTVSHVPVPVSEVSSAPHFPEPIPEGSESLSRTPTTITNTAYADPEDMLPSDCKIHRRQSSKNDFDAQLRLCENEMSLASSPKGGRRKGLTLFKSGFCGSFFRKCQGRSTVLKRVVTNPIWLGVTATTVTENTIVSAYLTYAAKYLQAEFRIPAHLASIHTGGVVVPSAVLGVLTGALLMRHFRPSITRTLFASLIPLLATLATVLILMLGLGCPKNQMAGVTATYDGKSYWQSGGSFLQNSSNLSAACNSGCRLTVSGQNFSCPLASNYNPVCWKQTSTPVGEPQMQMSFMNPCLAGCAGFRPKSTPDGKLEIYENCNCVTNSSLVPAGVHSLSDPVPGGTVTRGVCSPQCSNYVPFLIITFITIFLTSINQNPSNVITLSCVAPEDGTAALGLQVFFARTLGRCLFCFINLRAETGFFMMLKIVIHYLMSYLSVLRPFYFLSLAGFYL